MKVALLSDDTQNEAQNASALEAQLAELQQELIELSQ